LGVNPFKEKVGFHIVSDILSTLVAPCVNFWVFWTPKKCFPWWGNFKKGGSWEIFKMGGNEIGEHKRHAGL